MNPEIAIKELGKLVNLDIPLSVEGTCALNFEEELIEFEVTETELSVYGTIGSLEGKEFLYKQILENNFVSLQIASASLCLENNTLMLYRIFQAPIELQKLDQGVALFVSGVRYWKEWLKAAEIDFADAQSIEGENNNENIDTNIQMLRI